MTRLLEKENLAKETKVEIENMDGSISVKAPIFKFTGEFYQLWKK